MTKKQYKELEILDYFKQPLEKYQEPWAINTITTTKVSQGDTAPEEAYFAITDSGAKSVETSDIPRLYQLLDARVWAYRHIDMYEQGVLEGTTPYVDLVEDWPEPVAQFMAKSMFKGQSKDLILTAYANT